jgi:arylsulfatase A-like enzyme
MRPFQERAITLAAGLLILAFVTGLLVFLTELAHQGYLGQRMFWLTALSLRHALNAGLLTCLILSPLFLVVEILSGTPRKRLVQLGAGILSLLVLLLSVGLLLYRVTGYPLPAVSRYLYTSLTDAGRRETLFRLLANESAKNPGLADKVLWASIAILVLFLAFAVLFFRLDWGRLSRPLQGTRVRRTGLALLVFVVCTNLAVVVKRAFFEPDRPDIVLVYLDALRSDHLGCYGYDRRTSPCIDRLAGQGARFEQVISQAPSTFPSVHSAFTSKTASHFLDANGCLPPRHLTLAECLKNRGYTTVAISSSPVVTRSNTAYSLGGFEQGFDVFDESVAYGPETNWQWRSPEGVVEKALKWVDKADRPLFLFLYIVDPHSDYRCPEPFNSRFDPSYIGKEEVARGKVASYEEKTLKGLDPGLDERDIRHLVALYDGEIAYADSQLARLVTHLEQRGRLDGTVLALTSDHGEEFLEHGGLQHGYTLYNEVIRVPLVIRYPPRIPEGTVIQGRVLESLDMTPTLLDLAGMAKPAGMQGESLMAMIRDREATWRAHAVSESPFADKKALVTGRWKYIFSPGTRPLHPTLRAETGPARSLYDLEEDAGELRDVYAEHPEIAAGLHAILLDSLPRAERERLAVRKDLEMHPDVREQLKSLGYLE